MDAAATIANALGVVLARGFRSGLYGSVTLGVAPGLTEANYPILSSLARSGEPLSAASLAPDLGLDRSVVSRRASELIQAGLVAQQPSPRDRRQALLTLTPRGRTAIDEARRRLETVIAEHTSTWSEADRAALATLLSRFTATPLAATETEDSTHEGVG
ncbi:MarR family winged helix-turn-helix transcriptional regulator [Curtobacterium oceanosedimentum]|uniref:MarR family winged helix-turn-helix transcriptional regulator n=1 Tax=Curtobacterium oceanosedimentum TaxID=465820 RepID=UPI001CE0384E|nr:MarR family transcriptional regulator [Curtobacterium oceanosedimentum]MCA5924349.1 MarR family transcriptional regulator [Curtobacterium oceanosedimentum]